MTAPQDDADEDTVQNCELTAHATRCILDRMRRIAMCVIACACVAAVAALARPSSASAGWCWPSCASYALLGPATSTNTGCWFSAGEVCSYYTGNWFNVGMAKTCYPGCDWNYNTTGVMMYGFENHDRIRGKFSSKGAVTLYVRPYELSMSGMLRAQVTWYGGPPSQINAGAIG
jgi:hypothetical protein